MTTSSFRLPFDADPGSVVSRIDARDREGRTRAVDPRFNVALEASAGTGKTRVLVDRYINLLREGVDPSNVLAITFTRKAAAEMRERIIGSLRAAAARGEITAVRWRELRDRTADIAISTIDAFCLSLLREFPLEADLDPGFSMADDTEVPRFIDESLDRALRTCRGVAREDEDVALVFAQLGDRRARAGLATLLNRRIVAPAVLSRYLARGPRELTIARASRAGASALLEVFRGMEGGLDAFVASGPRQPAFALLARQLRDLARACAPGADVDPAAVQAAFTRAGEHFLTREGEPRARCPYKKDLFETPADYTRHRDLVIGHARAFAEARAGYRRDLNVLVSRGVWRMYRIAETEYRRTLESHAVLDFSDVLLRALDLLRQMEEFAQSRYRLEARYHHVLVDEFQDTSRAQWEAVSLLVQSWGEGAGLAHAGPLQPSIFIVGDRKQSIYSFRDADVSVLQEAARHLAMLRPDSDVRRSISRSFRSTPALLAFFNDVCGEVEKAAERRDAFRYDEEDRFPIDVEPVSPAPDADWRDEGIGLVVGESPEACARTTAAEIARLIASGALVRDRDTGVPRPVRAGDVAILFRTRESHRAFEDALAARGIPAYVYKGLGFFDADEIKDVIALLWYLAEPLSDLRAAALLRSRFVGLSDEGLRRLAPSLADAIRAAQPAPFAARLDAGDRRILDELRAASSRWRGLVDRLPPAELLDTVLAETGYAARMRGVRFAQARENLKKIRALVRRIQNRGYATLGRIVAHLDRLAVGDEANAVIDALDSVNLMTVHAAKGLEFPVVFLVNLARGTGNRRDPIRVTVDAAGEQPSVAVGDFRSEADEDDAAREREETKRLLYVALTRARDRLYLGTVLKEGKVAAGRGSLAEVLPAAMLAAIGTAVPGDVVRWRAHAMRVAPADDDCSGALASMASREGGMPEIEHDFAPLEDHARVRTSVTAPGGTPGAPASSARAFAGRAGARSERLLGTLVHRLIERLGLAATSELVHAAVPHLLTAEDLEEVPDPEALCAGATSAYAALVDRPDLIDLYRSGDALHEVPFTLLDAGTHVRGTIDCIVHGPDRATVLEFKTGRHRPEHDRQLELYRRAADALFPDVFVEARLVYLTPASV